jgi:hypothetical protein
MPNARLLVALFILLSIVWAGAIRAEEALPSAVGRISAATGAVSLHPAGGEWGAASLNDPLIAGIAVRTAAPAHATLGIGAAQIALSGATELEIAQLDATTRKIAVKQGRIGIHLARLGSGESVEIDLPRGGVWLTAPGDYDITAGTDQMPARVAVFAGQARFAGSGIDRTIAAGATLVLNARTPVAATLESAALDAFVTSWRPAPDAAAEAVAPRHVSPGMIGWEALEGAGSWEQAAGLGEVWFPTNLPEDWAPYRYGHWRWVMPWGWNWVDDMPWGFAPSQPAAGLGLPRRARRRPRALGLGPGRPRLQSHAGGGQLPGHCRDRPQLPRSDRRGGGVVSARPGRGLLAELYERSRSDPPHQCRGGQGHREDRPGHRRRSTRRADHRGLSEPPLRQRRAARGICRRAGGRAGAGAVARGATGQPPLLPGSPQIMPPASRPVVVAMAGAVHTLARILAPPSTRTAARTAILRPTSRTALAPTRTPFAARVVWSAHRAKARAVAAYARANRTRTHLAAAGRTRLH